MTQLHRDSTEANRHNPKGFDNGSTGSIAVKGEQDTSVYDVRNVLTQVISFTDGALPPPSTALGSAFVLIDTGGGAIDAGWTGATYGQWARSDGAIFFTINPSFGALCNDQNGDWFKYNGIGWDPFATGGGGGATDLSIGTVTATTVNVDSSTGTNATLIVFSDLLAGLTPASTGGIVKFLRADGAWTDVFQTINLNGTQTFLGTAVLAADAIRIHQEIIGGIGRITYEGTTGALLSIIDDKDNELWTASDISGNPVGYIDADWNVRLGNPFNRPFSIRYNSVNGVSYTKFNFPDYANDAAADADVDLLSGESYTTSALNRQIQIKP